ncbi:protein-L-isoaspartate O-methyltransferase [Rhizobium lusitanum]|jgi:protein-L-isoaspartate(D-aspartate) O-methyltransferase|uniref:Protein-L-isoaspartate O-methyltransferase n=2 Tax=Rhizobium/Agrobacterium group TaxID=227290 RepID=A0A1C3VDW6_9HYPH|nr:protein-L-isoaspartate(D-aspartate) O-methyltransferase [Rhizobium sp. SG570]NRP85457.1 Protein-L-isoaspartate O-methyltransferase [Ensifer adhaerens]NTJ06866.1 protein-L-isoaspartate O-methyltransferase [Rhizobium lusitanum]SCB26010.1 protein-L-isoaspartate(D-aspartate) O-methyltransferase [Rhizobium lusitanum]
MDFEAARVKMVENQIRTTDVTSHSVLNAFFAVPRENFVPEKSKLLAYVDCDIEIAPAAAGKAARFLMEASPLAKLLQLGVITKEDKVLDVGCGTGYVSAILSLIADKVVALEADEDLAAQAKANLAALGYDNVTVVTGDLEKGHAGSAPFNVIFVDGSVEQVPQALLDQLGEDGRLIAVLGYGHAARATVFMRERGAFSENVFFNASIKPLPGFAKAKEFVF